MDNTLYAKPDNRKIVFPYSKIRKEFRRFHFRPEEVENRVSAGEIQVFLSGLDSIVRSYRRASYEDFRMWFNYSVILLMAIAIVVLVAVAFGKQGKAGKFNFGFLFTALAVIIVTAVVLIFCSNHCLKKGRQKVYTDLRTKVKFYSAEREQFWESRGLRWVFPPAFPSWVELWKMYLPPDHDVSMLPHSDDRTCAKNSLLKENIKDDPIIIKTSQNTEP